MKNKTIVLIIAHPDDEAFGPSGTIAKLSKDNTIYIVCATKGHAGQDANPESGKKLEDRRVEELLCSAQVLGVKKVFFLGFRDGTLSNNLYHKIADKLQKRLEQLKPDLIISFSITGDSGHVDHVVMSLISSYVFYKLSFVKEMWQRVTTKERADYLRKDYFVYVPQGTEKSKVDKVLDVSDVWNTKLAAMDCHKSQKQDVERMKETSKKFPKEEYFMVLKK